MSAARVVIVGGGFGGLQAALALRRAPLEITLIDRRNFHLFQPLLYQVATGGLSPANIATPLRKILNRQANTRVVLGEVIGIDARQRVVRTHRESIEYDALVIATGVSHNYFGNEHWEPHAPGLKTIEDATEMRARVLGAFEAAERETDARRVREWLTFVIIGAGPTGVELAGALAEIARDTLRSDFRRIDPAAATILLIDAADRVLPGYTPDLSAKAARSLARLGVRVRVNTTIADIQPAHAVLRSAAGKETVATHCVLWAAGVRASPLGRAVAEATGAPLDKVGRVMVAPDLTVPGFPEVFVIGDLAHVRGPGDRSLPGIAPVAMQQGRYVARLIHARLRGASLAPFRYVDRGSMATIGRNAAVADLGWTRFNGYLAWLAWLFVHLLFLIEFENRVLVMIQWAWNYVTFGRAARLITNDPARVLAVGETPQEPVAGAPPAAEG
ncbi:MAG: NAD(P)/FAD-dependent oxidoreductase [Phycisphaerae bacterium]